VLPGIAIIAGSLLIEPMCRENGISLTATLDENDMKALLFSRLALRGSMLAHLQRLPPADAFAAD